MLEDIVITKEVLQALLLEMKGQGFRSTTLHEIRAFTVLQRRTPRALDCEACPADRHDYYRALLDYIYCPYCAERLQSQ